MLIMLLSLSNWGASAAKNNLKTTKKKTWTDWGD